MKRIAVIFLSLLFCLSVAGAKDNPVSLESGNILILKNTAAAVIEFDYSTMTIDGAPEAEYLSMQDEQYRADWQGVKTDAEAYFGPMFSKYIKGWTVSYADVPCQYRIVVRIETLSLGNMGQMFNPFSGAKAGGAEVSGKLTFVDLNTGETECVVAFAGVKGVTSFTEAARWGTAYMYLTKSLGKLLKQTK